jgi:GMP synthase PP-ATPase subunit
MVFTVTLDHQGLHNLALGVNRILQEQLAKAGGRYYGEARVYDLKSVGVQGDERTYLYVAEIMLRRPNGTIADDYEFIRTIGERITNEVRYVNRVMYVLK